MRLLVLNAGSSSVKFALYDEPLEEIARGSVADLGRSARWQLRSAKERAEEPVAAANHAEAARVLLDRLAPRLTTDLALVHRIVHGGDAFSGPTRLDDPALETLAGLELLAPTHLPAALAVIRVTREQLGATVPAIGVFDTGLFQTLPPEAREYALPVEWRVKHGVRRHGFHGFAHQCLRDAALRVGRAQSEGLRVITAQLGHGCSVAAFRGLQPIATSMGFSPLEGLVMPTRAGSVDAAAALYLFMRTGLSPQQLLHDLNERSGLLGLSGISAEPAELLKRAAQGDSNCALAVDVFTRRLHEYLGAYTSLLGGVDVLALGGGISEHVPQIRERALQGLAWLGCTWDRGTHDRLPDPVTVLSNPASKVLAIAVAVDEERVMAEQARALFNG